MKQIFLILLFLCAFLSAQTIVPAGNVSGQWTMAGSPYQVQGDISIANAGSLSIEPGVTVEFTGHFSLKVFGQISAIGTASDSILFTGPPATGWYGIRFENTSSANDSSRFMYCKFEYGNATVGSISAQHAGAMFIENFSKVRISHCLFRYNQGKWGGAMEMDGASPIIENSTFSGNYAIYSGAAIRCFDNANPLIRNNKIINNSVGSGGAGIYCYNANPLLISNKINNNTATSGGAGIAMDHSDPVFINNEICNNSADAGGAIHTTSVSYPTFVNNTIAYNNANSGGALYCYLESDPTFINNILWGNSAGWGSQVYLYNDDDDPNFDYCVIQDSLFGFYGAGSSVNYSGQFTNNLFVNPKFEDAAQQNYRLLAQSPCIDAGRPDTTGLHLPATDLAGQYRISGNAIDMGAHEFQIITAIEPLETISTFQLAQNYPNPFNPETRIPFTLEEIADVRLEIFDINGRRVQVFSKKQLAAGAHSFSWNGKNSAGETLANGMYFYRLISNQRVSKTRMMTLLK